MKSFCCFFSVAVLLFLFSCNQDGQQSHDTGQDSKAIEEQLLLANKQAVRVENEQIDSFVKRLNWQMTSTGSGLRYDIYFQGDGAKAEAGKLAVLKFTTQLIDGQEIYSSQSKGLKEFIIGQGGVESGLEEGILLLRVGDRAKFIIPSHLGFGLLGDQDKVPPKSTLIYDIELVALK